MFLLSSLSVGRCVRDLEDEESNTFLLRTHIFCLFSIAVFLYLPVLAGVNILIYLNYWVLLC